MDHYNDKFYSPTPILKHLDPEEVIKSSPTAALCFNQHNNEFHEDLHRQRVLVSAHHRSKIHRIRRSKTAMPRSLSRTGSAKGDDTSQMMSPEVDKDDDDKFEFIVTNFRKQSVDEDSKERYSNYMYIKVSVSVSSGFHKGHSWAPYCSCSTLMICPTIYIPISASLWMTPQCTWQSKVRRTHLSQKK